MYWWIFIFLETQIYDVIVQSNVLLLAVIWEITVNFVFSNRIWMRAVSWLGIFL